MKLRNIWSKSATAKAASITAFFPPIPDTWAAAAITHCAPASCGREPRRIARRGGRNEGTNSLENCLCFQRDRCGISNSSVDLPDWPVVLWLADLIMELREGFLPREQPFSLKAFNS